MEKQIDVLNKGFVRLVDCMGTDASIVQAARVSYGAGTKTQREDQGLINYLLKNKHTSPFEMVEFKFHCKMPIFVARQWVRHRMASLNEYSMRYSEAVDDYYVPELDQIRKQSTTNKQGRDEQIEESEALNIQKLMDAHSKTSYGMYKILLNNGLARELARCVLPVNFYTEWYWKIDLHNLLHFLRLRMDSHAQYEIRVFANAIYDIIKEIVPMTCEAFEKYVINSKTFDAAEAKELTNINEVFNISETYTTSLSEKARSEFLKKMGC
jgi:thymidylate synthase (FAD)